MISSSQNDTAGMQRTVSSQEKVSDSVLQNNVLRPLELKDYVGQSQMKKHIEVSIQSAKIRQDPLEHVLFYGPPGLGKTTIANIIAHEMGAQLRSTSGPAIEKQSDLVSMLSNLKSGDVLFIDEIHRLRPQIEEILYTAMEDFCLDIMVGSGMGAQSVKVPVEPFTLIGATTRLSALSSPLRDRFGNVLKLDFYTPEDLEIILRANTKKLELDIPSECLHELAKKSRGTPRIANRLLKILRDYHTIGRDISSRGELSQIFLDIGIDETGLDLLDNKYLRLIAQQFSGGPVGLGTLSSTLGEEESTIEDVVEPYLLQIGFIERTPRGRRISVAGREHIEK